MSATADVSSTSANGLANGSLRKIHAVLMGAGKRAVCWRWVGVNPFEQADALPTARPEPKPLTADQAARIATEAWKDLDWGLFVWLAMVTGARRGELCALTWDSAVLKLGAGVLTIRSSIAQRGGRTWEKDTKTLDPAGGLRVTAPTRRDTQYSKLRLTYGEQLHAKPLGSEMSFRYSLIWQLATV